MRRMRSFGSQKYVWGIRLERPGFGIFISGPSKTTDIEQALVIGTHGARTCTLFMVGSQARCPSPPGLSDSGQAFRSRGLRPYFAARSSQPQRRITFSPVAAAAFDIVFFRPYP